MADYSVIKYRVENGYHDLVLDPINPTDIIQVDFINHDGTLIEDVQPTTVPNPDGGVYYKYEHAAGVGKINAAVVHDINNTTTYVVGDVTALTTHLVYEILNDKFDCPLMLKIEAIKGYIVNMERELAADMYDKAIQSATICTTDKYPKVIHSELWIDHNRYILT